MKVLVHNRDPHLWVGGDAVQVENTLVVLSKLGVDVTFTSDTFDDPTGFDVVHIFHINFIWTLPMIWNCQKKNIPYVVSTIFFDQEVDATFPTMQEALAKAKKVIALSKNEKNELLRRFPLDPKKITVVSNGVDPTIFHPGGEKQEYALYVGRMSDSSKGALQAIHACTLAGKKIICVGQSNDSEYSKECVSRCVHIEHATQEQLALLYQSASVYICSSLSERQSLSVLEAAACGCPVVDSMFNRGSDLLPSSEVVDPRDVKNIEKALLKQWGKKNTDIVPTWEDVATQLMEIYAER